MVRTLIILLSIALCASAVHGQAPDTAPAYEPDKWETVAECRERLKSPVKCFGVHARASFAVCSMTWKVVLMNGQTERARSCMSSAREAMPPHYQAALKGLSKNKAGVAMLKDAYALWTASMNDLIPEGTQGDYARRTIAHSRELDQIMSRLLLEE